MSETAGRLVVEDQLAVQRVLAEYCHRMDAGDFEAVVELFTPDGTFSFGRRSATGRDALVAWFGENHPPEQRGLHATTDLVVDLDDDGRARAVSSYLFVRWIDGALVTETAGRYHDVLVRGDGGWLIEHREARMLRPPR